VANIGDVGTTFTTGQVSVNPTTPVQIVAVRGTRTKLSITSTVPLLLADTSPGCAAGYAPFGTVNGGIAYDIPTQDAVWALSAGSNGTVYFADLHS
jgi:hypothetical protein